MNVLNRVFERQLLKPGSYPEFIQKCTVFQVIMGSEAYGISTKSSDVDIYGFCIPPKDIIFPHLAGKIYGFDSYDGFQQWQNHHVEDLERGKTYDFSIYNIVNYVRLLTDGNPNIIDSLFVPRNCILHSTPASERLRQDKHLFLHRGCFHKFTGYMMSQISKLERVPVGKRKESFEKWGFDLKYASHAVRLGLQIEQVLNEGTLELDRNREILKSIRGGEWSVKQIRDWVHSKEIEIQKAYSNSKLPNKPDRNKIRNLLLEILEQHYGSLDSVIVSPDKNQFIINQIKELLYER